ncbi:cell division protein FtsL [Streptomyces sp. NPDC092296]|uniref:cell division protein FtsL n=1 Tax=Streptomyces sp. NPDC092296 TaxID=3366012 RepID=UPI0037FD702E
MPAAGTAGPRRLPGQAGARSRPAVRRTAAGRRQGPGRMPFAVLVVVLLAVGLIGLLMLNTALNQGSFELSRLQRETTRLTDEQQSLEQQIDQWSAPGALERRAARLGMVPGGNPAFLRDDGKILGSPAPATGAPTPTASATARGTVPAPTPQSSAVDITVRPAPGGTAGGDTR